MQLGLHHHVCFVLKIQKPQVSIELIRQALRMFHLNLRLGVRDSHKGSPADYDPNLIPRWHFSWYLVKLLINLQS